MSDSSSYGSKLLHEFGLRQGACFNIDESATDFLDNLKNSRVGDEKPRRKQPLTKSDLLMVLSQDCDIGCKKDSDDRFIELAHLKPIKSKELEIRNQFCQSVRKLQLEINNRWYEAKVAYIVWAEKEQLAQYLNSVNVEILKPVLLPEKVSKLAASWRALRYSRVALPDQFDRVFKPELEKLLLELNEHQKYVRGLYLWLDSFEELEKYAFSFMAVTKVGAPDDVVSGISDLVEDCSIALEASEELDLTLTDSSFCARVDDLFLKEFIRFVKVNVDHVSISTGEPVEIDD